MYKLLIGLFLLYFSTTTVAQVTCGTPVNQCEGPAREVITRIFPVPNLPEVRLESAVMVNSSACTGVNGFPVVNMKKPQYDSNGTLIDGLETFDETYALLLTAYAANEKIQLKVDASEPVCTVFFIAQKP